MKIRAKVSDSPLRGYEEGNIFEAKFSNSGESYIFIDNDGDERSRPIEEFEVVEDEKVKEEVVKIIAIEGCHPNLTVGKVYNVVEKSYDEKYWRVVNDCGFTDGYRPRNNFEVFEDKPEIEVGSEWVDHKGNALTVEYVGKQQIVCTWNDTGKEFTSPVKNHLKFYKPKPKTVTMYFYWDNSGVLCATEDNIYKTTFFTREIDLP